jgi:intraflagellar transport protein 140
LQHACPQFFFGGEIGSVHYADDLGHITDVQVLNHAIDAMMFYEEKNQLIVITRGLQLIVFQVGATDGTVKAGFKVKLSVASEGCLHETKWTGPGMLAIASGEPLVRFWDLQREENSVLNLPKTGASGYNVSAIDFSPRRRILAAGTAQGMVFFWRSTSIIDASKPNSPPLYRWDFLFSASIAQSVVRVGWNNISPTLYANTTEGVVVLHEGNMQRSLCGDLAVIQTHPSDISIEKYRDGTVTQASLKPDIRIKGVSHDGSGLVVWGGSKAEVYELKDGEPKRISQFKCSSSSMVLRGDFLYRTNGNHVEICNVQGVVKNSISFTEAEGKPYLLSLQGKFLAVATDQRLLRVFDLSRRDPKAIGSMGNFSEAFGEETKSAIIRSICVNADGTRVCILADKVEGALKIRVPQSKLFLFQNDLNIYQQYDFGRSSYPISVFFDPVEPRLLACETVKTGTDSGNRESPNRREPVSEETGGGANVAGIQRGNGASDKEVTIFFASNDHGLMMQDSFELETKYQALLGIQVPRVYFVAHVENTSKEETTTVVHVGGTKGAAATKTPASTANDVVSYLRTRIMRDFIGLDKVNDAARQALIDFCYYMTIGSMDEAYRSVKLIENPSVWENMAKMCVKTKRLDVAEVCLGNMGHARGAAAVQEAKLQPEPEVPIAMVAVQLGLRDDAARLYRECGRYDQLNRLYQASGFWQKAVDVAAKRDRIHLKSTYHSLGEYYEEVGDIKAAMEAYEDASTHQKDIPRMLFKLGKLDLLQKYVATSNDRELTTWWAQYEESLGHFDLAIESYEKAKDYLSIVRVLCFKKDFHAAAKVVKTSGNRAAAYHLARQFEAHDDVPSAIHFFACGGCYNHAIRLAKEHQLDTDLMSYALMSKPSDMIECAAYFEERREMEKAVQLYQKGGNVAKALDLCFQAQLFDELHHLTDELGPNNTSPGILKKCADFFIENGHYAKAVHLLLVGNRVSEALDVCMQHDVKVTEEMAEKMTPPKEDKGAAGDKVQLKRRTDLLLKLAKCCKQQGAYHLATKKYTQAGDKLKAMKCLLKSGDTEKVIFFANVSRNNEIFILAANYLQNLDWRKDGEVLKHIVGFYTKARAFEQLASFYSSCAQAEIEEYRDYDKAVGALREAIKVLSKARSDAKERLTKGFELRIALIEKFMDCRQKMHESPSEAGEAVMKLLDEPGIDEAIRVGDALAMLVEAHYDAGDLRRCIEVLEEMRRRGLAAKSYVNARMLQEIQAKSGTAGSVPVRSEHKEMGGEGSDDERPAGSSARGSSRPSSREAKGRPEEPAMMSARGKPSAGGRDDDDDEMEEDIAEED